MITEDANEQSNDSGSMWLVGFRIDPNYPEPDFYTILLQDRSDQPILHQGQIIFFADFNDRQLALELDSEFAKIQNQTAPGELYLVYDIANVLYLVSNESRDESASIVNFLNVLFDMLKSVSVSIPSRYKTVLYQVADHLTFDKDFGDFLEAEGIARTEVVEAIQWGIGSVITKSTFVPKSSPWESVP
jgi:hypothetical protein